MDENILEDGHKYEEAWLKTMLEIWKEKIERLRVIRTGALHQSFDQQLQQSQRGDSLKMRFLRYGIYQALGTGYGYVSAEGGNTGDLHFLDKDYRHKHRLDKKRKVGPAWGGYLTSGQPRKRRDWFNRAFFRSVMALKEDMARITGDTAAKIICDALTDARAAVRR